MTTREPLPARVRFGVFKRDGFTCRYCGSRPPDVVLHVDHVEPVALGGSDDEENLITSCERCNLGKGAVPLEPRPVSHIAQETVEREREIAAQMDAYNAMMREKRERYAAAMTRFLQAWADANPGRFLPPEERREGLSQILARLPVEDVVDAIGIASRKVPIPWEPAWHPSGHKATTLTYPALEHRFRYMCAVCWSWIRNGRTLGVRP